LLQAKYEKTQKAKLMTKPNYADIANQQDRQAKALEAAKSILKSKGIDYPIYDPELSPETNYGALMAYSEQESALVIQYMRMPSGPRPIVLDTTEPPKDWENKYDR